MPVNSDRDSAAQRAEYGFSEEDTFSFDYHLARVIAGGVGRIAERGHGYPEEMTEEEWRAILEEIVLGFRLYAQRKPFNDVPPEFDRAFDLLREWWGHLWD